MQDGAWGKSKQLLLPLGKEKLSVEDDDVSCERRPNKDHGCSNDHRGNKNILHQPLYKSKENTNLDGEFSTLLRDLPKLTEEEAEKQNGDLTLQEVSTALKNNKNPGTDGFSVEFYKFF